MRNRVATKLAAVVAGVYILGFLFFFVFAILNFTVSGVDQRYFAAWISAESFINWFDAIIILTVTAFITAFSLFISRKDMPSTAPDVIKMMQGMVAGILILTIFFAILQYGLYPRVVQTRDDYLRFTQRSRALLESVAVFQQEDDYASAIQSLQEYLTIHEADDEAQLELLNMQRELVQQADNGEVGIDYADRISVRAQHAGDLLARARRRADSEDWFSALYYGRLAKRFDPSREDVTRFVQQVENKIGAAERLEGADLSIDEQQQQQLFRGKQLGLHALLRGDPVQAYYIFLQLEEDFPFDPDVRKYLPITVSGDHEMGVIGVRDLTFFIPEAQEALNLPGYNDLLLVHRWDNERRELVSIGKMVYGRSGVFFDRIEFIALDENGRILHHMSAPRGKLVSGNMDPIVISLHGIHPQYAEIWEEPQYHVGSFENPDNFLLQLNISLRELESFDGLLEDLAYTPLGLYRALQVWPEYGFDVAVPAVYFFMALLRPFTLFLLVFAAMGLAIRLHSRYYGRFPISGVLLIPLIPVAAAYAVRTYEYVMQIFIATTVTGLGFAAALAILLLLQIFMFTAALLFTTRELMVRE